MQCLTPTVLHRREGYRSGSQGITDVFPCGKCPACLRKRSAGWVFRLQQELLNSNNSLFITLTYSDENLPFTPTGLPTLNRKHPQLWLKRMRRIVEKNFPQDKSIKYYLCGEYGSKTDRPHYHAIMYNVPPEYLNHPELFQRDWQLGHVDLAPNTIATMRYVTKYIMKTMYTHKPDENDDRVKEFSNMSKGLGKGYLTPKRVQFYKRKLIPYLLIENGDKHTMPRYYRDKFYTEKERKKVNKKTEKYLQEHPEYQSEKHRQDFAHHQFIRQAQRTTLERQKL